ERFVARLDETRRDIRLLHRARLAAIGPETARALELRHLRPDLVPEEFRAEGLIEAFGRTSLAGARILLPRAAGARSILPEELGRAGALVDEVTTYRSATLPTSVPRLRAALDAGPIDCITFTSSSTVRGFLELLDAADASGGQRRIADARVA